MAVSDQVRAVQDALGDAPKMGQIKALAAKLGCDPDMARALWATEGFNARLVAVLVMDKKALDQTTIEELATDIAAHPKSERRRLAEWFMAHQLMKSKPALALLTSWQDHRQPLLRHLFWYHQARLRWTGQTPPDNTTGLVAAIEADLAGEDADVQWAMNFCAGWIGVYDVRFRDRLVALGEKTGLYRDDPVSRGCTPDYLPAFIEIEVAKRA